eukprot:1159996-Pelagomonas_calceolata.AAC.2
MGSNALCHTLLAHHRTVLQGRAPAQSGIDARVCFLQKAAWTDSHSPPGKAAWTDSHSSPGVCARTVRHRRACMLPIEGSVDSQPRQPCSMGAVNAGSMALKSVHQSMRSGHELRHEGWLCLAQHLAHSTSWYM